MLLTCIFGFIWGFVTSALGISWFDGNLPVAFVANVIPIFAVSYAVSYAVNCT